MHLRCDTSGLPQHMSVVFSANCRLLVPVKLLKLQQERRIALAPAVDQSSGRHSLCMCECAHRFGARYCSSCMSSGAVL